MIETARLILTEMTDADFDALYAVLGDSDIMRHYPYTFDAARVQNWIDRNRDRYRTLGFGLWAMRRRDTGEMIGDCGLTMQIIHGVICPEIGYHVRADHQRQGYAREAARAVRDWTFQNTPFRCIYSYMHESNLPSQATARAYGATYRETYCDPDGTRVCVYRLTREEWQEMQSSAGRTINNDH